MDVWSVLRELTWRMVLEDLKTLAAILGGFSTVVALWLVYKKGPEVIERFEKIKEYHFELVNMSDKDDTTEKDD